MDIMPAMRTTAAPMSPPTSKTAPLAEKREVIERLAKASDLTPNSIRTMLRTGIPPRNRHVRDPCLRALSKELAKADVPADMDK